MNLGKLKNVNLLLNCKKIIFPPYFYNNDLANLRFCKLPCPDQIVGEIILKHKKYKLSSSIIQKRKPFNPQNVDTNIINYCINYKNLKKENYIIFILESPHVDEFDKNKIIGPAAGKKNRSAGYNLENELDNVLKKSFYLTDQLKSQKYKLVLLNAVQYQTSCGISPICKNIRDSNWLYFWQKYFRNELIRRLKSFVKTKGEIHIVNLCTFSNNCLHYKVLENLTMFKNVHVGYHPACNWNNNKYKMIY